LELFVRALRGRGLRWYDPRVEPRRWEDQKPAFWLAPLASTLPLIVFFGLPWSPLFLGRLMGDPIHPFLRPGVGPWLATIAVIFDGTVLAYLMAGPVYLLLKAAGKISAVRVVIFFVVAGILTSQLVHVLQNFRQPELRAFAVSWLSPVIGCLCGLVAGSSFVLLARRPLPTGARVLAWMLPVGVLVACGSALVWGGK
jgi:hypothetical protein